MGTTSWTLTGKPNPHSPTVGGDNDAWKQSLPLYVLHMDDEIVHWVTGDGLLHSVPPGEVYEFTNRFHGRKFLEHKWMHGPVEVEIMRTNRGIEFRLDPAVAAAKAALAEAEHRYIEGYIETQTTDRLGTGHPAMKPSTRQQRKIKKHGINLQDYGIVPVGTRSSMETQMEAVLQQNQLMMGILAELLKGNGIQPATAAKLGQTVKTPARAPAEMFDQTPRPIREDVVGDPVTISAGDVNTAAHVTPEVRVKPIVEYSDPNADLPIPAEFADGTDPNSADSIQGPPPPMKVAPRSRR